MGDEFSEGGDGLFDGRRPGHAAVDSDAVLVFAGGGEDDSGADGDAGLDGAVVEVDGIDIFREFGPEEEAALGAGDAGFVGEVFGHEVAHAFDLLVVDGGDFAEVAFVAAILHELGEGELGEGGGGDVEPGFGGHDVFGPFAGDAPADAEGGSDGFGEAAADHDVAFSGGGVVVTAAGARFGGRIAEVGVDVVFNEGDVGLADHGDEAAAVFFGHDGAEGVVDGGDEDDGFDEVFGEDDFEGVQRGAGAGMGGDFEGFEAEHFEGLENAPVCWGFDGDGIAGFGDGAKAEVDGFECSAGDDDVVWGEGTASTDVPAGDLPAKAEHSGWGGVGGGEEGLRAADGVHHGVDFFHAPIGDSTVGGAHGDGAGLTKFCEEEEAEIADSDDGSGFGRAGHLGFGDVLSSKSADIEAGLRARLEAATIFEEAIGGNDGGDGDFELDAEGANGGGACPDGDSAAVDHADNLSCNLLIDRGLWHFWWFRHEISQYSSGRIIRVQFDNNLTVPITILIF